LWLSFHSQFLSQLGLGALTNQGVTFESCFIDDFEVGTDSVFVDLFLVNMGCEHFRFHTIPLEGF
jgi:hypothetical protein